MSLFYLIIFQKFINGYPNYATTVIKIMLLGSGSDMQHYAKTAWNKNVQSIIIIVHCAVD